MFKQLLNALDKVEQNGLSERIDKNPITKKYWIALGGSIILLLGTVLVNIAALIEKKNIQPAELRAVLIKDNKIIQESIKEVPITLPTAHHSFKNLISWVKDSIRETYTFNFLNFDEQTKKAEKYFTPEGYQTYIKALQETNVEKDIKTKRLEVVTIPMQTPVLINSGVYGDLEFWRFRVPVLVSIQAGKEPLLDNYMMELLIILVPPYENPKGLAIAEYKMAKL